MSSNKIIELKSDVEELTKLINLATRPKIKDILTLEVRKIETEIIKLNEHRPSVESNDQPTADLSTKSQGNTRRYDVKLTNYAWDQSDAYVKLFVNFTKPWNLETEFVTCKFTKRSVEMRVNGPDNYNYILTINNLLNDVDESKSHWKVKKDMVVIFLSKTRSANWAHLTANDQKTKDSHKKDIEDVADPSEDPSEGLINLMKKMYNEGDDEMKRTITKAWYEGREKGGNPLN